MRDTSSGHELSEALTEFLLREICELKRKATAVHTAGNESILEVATSSQVSSTDDSCGRGTLS